MDSRFLALPAAAGCLCDRRSSPVTPPHAVQPSSARLTTARRIFVMRLHALRSRGSTQRTRVSPGGNTKHKAVRFANVLVAGSVFVRAQPWWPSVP